MVPQKLILPQNSTKVLLQTHNVYTYIYSIFKLHVTFKVDVSTERVNRNGILITTRTIRETVLTSVLRIMECGSHLCSPLTCFGFIHEDLPSLLKTLSSSQPAIISSCLHFEELCYRGTLDQCFLNLCKYDINIIQSTNDRHYRPDVQLPSTL